MILVQYISRALLERLRVPPKLRQRPPKDLPLRARNPIVPHRVLTQVAELARLQMELRDDFHLLFRKRECLCGYPKSAINNHATRSEGTEGRGCSRRFCAKRTGLEDFGTTLQFPRWTAQLRLIWPEVLSCAVAISTTAGSAKTGELYWPSAGGKEEN